jgi:hypothetical protein
MARTVAVLGGGVGGLAVDRKLRARLAPADRVVLVERSTWKGSTTGGGDTLPWGTCPRRSSTGALVRGSDPCTRGFRLEPAGGFEPPACGLQIRRSAAELRRLPHPAYHSGSPGRRATESPGAPSSRLTTPGSGARAGGWPGT